ncbi:DUF262 domain-containing protein [Vreelandella zhanjiangensis]|uniref:DUF262 domain-containing protein n=1 Tax=Vreelandella zhanjiangensis TaxID=1121960 RepID=UPI00402AD218
MLGKKELNNQIRSLIGQNLQTLNSSNLLKLVNIDSPNDSIVFEKDNGTSVKRKLSHLRILIENLLEFPAINPAQILGRSYSSIKELVILLANLPKVSYFKHKSIIYLTLEFSISEYWGVNELPPSISESVITKISKLESLDRKSLLRELVNVYNTLSIIEREEEIKSLKPLIKQLRDFKEQSDVIFENSITSEDKELESNEFDLDNQHGDSYIEDDKKFDPSKLDIKTSTPTVDLLMSRVQHNEIILNPDFQRKDRIWKDKDKSALIESILLKIPVPVFYMSAMENDKWLIVDGLQRITTIYDFIRDQFPLKGLEILEQYEGIKFSQFPRSLERRLKETEFVVHVIQPDSPKSATTQIFQRINTKGEKLSDQEIRSSLNVGFATKFLIQLAESDEFINATNNSINPSRMKDIEYVLRFCAFYFVKDYSRVNIKTMDIFLTDTMVRINDQGGRTNLIKQLEIDFLKSMRYCQIIFGDYAFRKRRGKNQGNAINKALFDTWSVTLARLDESELRVLECRKEILFEKFDELMEGSLVLAAWEQEINSDKNFEFSISQSTSKNDMVRYRYLSIFNLIKEVLKGDF